MVSAWGMTEQVVMELSQFSRTLKAHSVSEYRQGDHRDRPSPGCG